MTDSALTVQFIHKSWGEKILFDDLSFSVERGKKTTLLGPEGAGKSTLLRIMAGLDKDYIGAVTRRAHQTFRYLGQRIRVTAVGKGHYEDGDLTLGRTVGEEVLSIAGSQGGRSVGRVQAMAVVLGLDMSGSITHALSER